jgi:regulator of protease activity HflC (stomatin/prohibitin superfamily)
MASNTPEPRAKRWGFVSALPSEYLVVYRGGKLRERVSRQGGRCWKWPSDTVAIVPTTLKEVLFRANQITVDNVDVQLRGMVLYRISDPLTIYRLINFTNREQAEAKLGRIIADTCRSNAKWLVANMSVEQCLRRRKEEIAAALTAEVARVVGSGESGGWGIEIVTVDIQDIYIQDSELFSNLQARFKAEREGEAALARLAAREQITRSELTVERTLAEERHRLDLDKARLAAELERLRVEQNGAIEHDRTRRENEREGLAAEGRRDRACVDAEARTVVDRQALEALEGRVKAENAAAPASLERLFITEALPAVARALAESASDMRFNVMHTAGPGSSDATPFGFLLGQIVELLDQKVRRTEAR